MRIEKARRVGWVQAIVPAGPAARGTALLALREMAEKMGAEMTGPVREYPDALIFGDGSEIAYRAQVTEL